MKNALGHAALIHDTYNSMAMENAVVLVIYSTSCGHITSCSEALSSEFQETHVSMVIHLSALQPFSLRTGAKRPVVLLQLRGKI